jgi:cob(I)alamin adenosyltransferase
MSISKSGLYTRRGDSGSTDLYTGQRCKKSDVTFDVLGCIDKLNVHIGDVKSNMNCLFHYSIIKYLTEIQGILLTLGSSIGSLSKGIKSKRKIFFDKKHVKELEHRIDMLSYQLPKLKTFILPEGEISSKIHICRVVTRELERKMVSLSDTRDIQCELQYVNRLSDYYFELARNVHKLEQKYNRFTMFIATICIVIIFI